VPSILEYTWLTSFCLQLADNAGDDHKTLVAHRPRSAVYFQASPHTHGSGHCCQECSEPLVTGGAARRMKASIYSLRFPGGSRPADMLMGMVGSRQAPSQGVSICTDHMWVYPLDPGIQVSIGPMCHYTQCCVCPLVCCVSLRNCAWLRSSGG
jgi:hypothetical protein